MKPASRLHAPSPWLLLAICLVALRGALLAADAPATPEIAPFLSPIFGDNMVLQRGKPNTFWGWTKPGEKVRVKIADKSAEGTAGADGRWQVRLDPPPAGGPYSVDIDGSEHRTLHEVLIGDVWLCSGQSNMAMGLAGSKNGAEEIKAALHPEIRLFTVGDRPAYSPVKTVRGSWKVCTPETAGEGFGGVSAVAYFFGRKLQQELHVPIGLIADALGGTPAECWASPESLHALKLYEQPLAEVDRFRSLGGTQYGSYLMHWLDEYDTGTRGTNWGAADFDDSAWKTVEIPGGFKELGVPDTPSICWFRREITLPDPLPAGKAMIRLGVIEKMDTTFINGQWVGASSWVENPRAYFLRPGVLKPGKNLIALRVFKLKPEGGFESPATDLKLTIGDQTFPLAGTWKAALSADARPPHPLPLGYENYPTVPTVLYHGMIEPLAPLSLTGAIWYQGEANAERAFYYRTLLPAMIGSWRTLFKQDDFPFYIAGLPAFMHRKTEPGTDAWAELREAQALVAKQVPNTGLAVTIDTGDADNIHPTEKLPVGERLALCALGQTYHLPVAWQGPTYQTFEKLPGALRIHFSHTEEGLIVKGDRLGEFSVAGADRKWHWADARIEGNTVVVSSPDVPEPVAVRYAWQSNPLATLFNRAGLPAVPFRTDDWPTVTSEHKPW